MQKVRSVQRLGKNISAVPNYDFRNQACSNQRGRQWYPTWCHDDRQSMAKVTLLSLEMWVLLKSTSLLLQASLLITCFDIWHSQCWHTPMTPHCNKAFKNPLVNSQKHPFTKDRLYGNDPASCCSRHTVSAKPVSYWWRGEASYWSTCQEAVVAGLSWIIVGSHKWWLQKYVFPAGSQRHSCIEICR